LGLDVPTPASWAVAVAAIMPINNPVTTDFKSIEAPRGRVRQQLAQSLSKLPLIQAATLPVMQ
jgi:hypothetical protein